MHLGQGMLISQGHEILWIGHSRIEFGKDIVSVDPSGAFHAFQIKDEDLPLLRCANTTLKSTSS